MHFVPLPSQLAKKYSGRVLLDREGESEIDVTHIYTCTSACPDLDCSQIIDRSNLDEVNMISLGLARSSRSCSDGPPAEHRWSMEQDLFNIKVPWNGARCSSATGLANPIANGVREVTVQSVWWCQVNRYNRSYQLVRRAHNITNSKILTLLKTT
jgi:hypothetical protein